MQQSSTEKLHGGQDWSIEWSPPTVAQAKLQFCDSSGSLFWCLDSWTGWTCIFGFNWTFAANFVGKISCLTATFSLTTFFPSIKLLTFSDLDSDHLANTSTTAKRPRASSLCRVTSYCFVRRTRPWWETDTYSSWNLIWGKRETKAGIAKRMKSSYDSHYMSRG